MASHGIDSRRAKLTPLEWIWASPALREYFLGSQTHPRPIMVADFGPGENGEVPLFFAKTFHEFTHINAIVYCIDVHELRLESLMNTLQEDGVAESSRMVLANLEAMSSQAMFLRPQAAWLEESKENQTSIDRSILTKCRVPSGAFKLGVLNNDLLGYLKEYYGMHDKLDRCLREMRTVMAPSSVLVLTQPGMLYPMDSVAALEGNGFAFVEAIDVDLADNSVQVSSNRVDAPRRTMMNHYCAIMFTTEETESGVKPRI